MKAMLSQPMAGKKVLEEIISVRNHVISASETQDMKQ